MKQATLRGTHVEMGRWVGEQLRADGEELPKLTDEQARYTEALVRQVAGRIPDLLSEMRGIAEGGVYDEQAVHFYSLAIGIVPACTAIAVSGARTAAGRTLFGRNHDAGPKWSNFTLYRTYPDKGFAHIGCCYDMLVGREDGLNEAGLAVAYAGVHGHYTSRPGVWDHIPVRAVLEQCQTVDEALDLIQGLPHLYTKNFLVADASGAIVVVEAAQQNISIVRSRNGFGAITNHFVAPHMRAYCNEAKVPANSTQRLETAHRWFDEAEARGDKIGWDELKRLLSSTDRGVRSELGSEFTTAWSWVAELAERRIELCDRLPDAGAYREHAV
ncbi:MAG: C45 family autoproteolytic acyltransferase/hydrolase [Candidatus Bipolaricaulota bacterium]|nr:C45 family autoproteolytic acyltransferase/hydrolase [Candidatus Bipolaricaulota bacterium]